MRDSLWSVEPDEDVVRPRLPIEDLDNGLYIHPGSVVVAAFITEGEESPESDGERFVARYYVRAEDFMDMQKERDDLKRALALVNATRVGPVDDHARLRRIYALCDKEGFGVDEARAMASLIAEVATETRSK